MSGGEVRVMLVDDQRFARRGFMLMLRRDPGIVVVAEAEDGADALARVTELLASGARPPDVVLMDVRMPRMGGVDATAELTRAHPAVRVIVLTTYDEDDAAFGALAAGASGFLLKDVRAPDLVRAVRAVAAGDAILTPRITRAVLDRGLLRARGLGGADGVASLLTRLTPRERQVASLIADGLANAEIAAHMSVEAASVRRYVSRILAKLSLRDRVQIAVAWHQEGLP